MIDTFLFDFDGTVADTIPGIIATLDKTRAAMDCHYDLDEAKSLIGTPLTSMGAVLCGEKRAAEFVNTYRSEYLHWGLDKIKFFPGMEDLLQDLKTAGYATAVVTSKRRDSLLSNLDILKAHDYFDLLVTKESTDLFKPHPAPVEYALVGLDAAAENAVMIGDTHFDIESGNGAGVTTIAVTWGIEDEATISRCHPDFIVNDAAALQARCFALAKA